MRIEIGKAYYNGKFCARCGRGRVTSYRISEYSTEAEATAVELAMRDECIETAKILGSDLDDGHHYDVTRHPIDRLLHYEFPAEGMERYRWFIPFFLRPLERLLKKKGKIS